MTLPAGSARTANRTARDTEHSILKTIEKQVLWLSIQMVHYANSVRENEDGIKVGGHPASSASLVSLMTALWFRHLRPTDRVSVKPHASPVYHAIQYLLGNLPQEKLRQFRSYGGIQAYPSRTKDCDSVDFSTGSVGLGAVMPTFSALARALQENLHNRYEPQHHEKLRALWVSIPLAFSFVGVLCQSLHEIKECFLLADEKPHGRQELQRAHGGPGPDTVTA